MNSKMDIELNLYNLIPRPFLEKGMEFSQHDNVDGTVSYYSTGSLNQNEIMPLKTTSLSSYLEKFINDDAPPGNFLSFNEHLSLSKETIEIFIKRNKALPTALLSTATLSKEDRFLGLHLALSLDVLGVWNIKNVALRSFSEDLDFIIFISNLSVDTFKKLTEERKVTEILPPKTIQYNEKTGKGSIGSKKFTLKDGSPEYLMFKLLHKKLNTRVTRYEILLAIHFYEENETRNPQRKTQETNAINDTVKKLRAKLKLTPEQLVQNGGNITLIWK